MFFYSVDIFDKVDNLIIKRMKILKPLTLSLALCALTSSTTIFCQLGSIKIKKPKVALSGKTKVPKLKKAKSSSPSLTIRKRNEDGSPKYDGINNPDDPIYSASSNIKQKLQTAKSGLEDSRWPSSYSNRQVSGALTSAKKDIDYLSSVKSEGERDYLMKYHKGYDALELKRNGEFETFNNTTKITKEIDNWMDLRYDYSSARSSMYREHDTTLRYVEYIKYRKETQEKYPKDFNSEGFKAEFKKMDDYFNLTVYTHIEKMNNEIEETVKQMNQKYRGEGNYEEYKYEPNRYLTDLNQLSSHVYFYKRNLISDVVKIQSTESKLNTEKKKLEDYINKGEYDEFLIEMEEAKLAKEFLPKAEASNSNLQSKAIKYIKGDEMKKHLTDRLGRKPVASVLKANVVTVKPKIKKNKIDLPKYKYHVIWVAFKDEAGNCYKTPVYATYQYMGGGTYESIPTYSADKPIQMACGNVNK